MRVRSLCWMMAAIGLTVFTLACGQSTTAPVTLSTVIVAGVAPTVGQTTQFTATATHSDNSIADVTSQATWASSSTAVATIAATGAVTGVAPGTMNLTATYQGLTGSLQITVAAP